MTTRPDLDALARLVAGWDGVFLTDDDGALAFEPASNPDRLPPPVIDEIDDGPEMIATMLNALPIVVAEARRLEGERDAYRKAKQENDERFMNERDAARAEVERLNAQAAMWHDASDAVVEHLRDASAKVRGIIIDERDAALAEVERLRGLLATPHDPEPEVIESGRDNAMRVVVTIGSEAHVITPARALSLGAALIRAAIRTEGGLP